MTVELDRKRRPYWIKNEEVGWVDAKLWEFVAAENRAGRLVDNKPFQSVEEALEFARRACGYGWVKTFLEMKVRPDERVSPYEKQRKLGIGISDIAMGVSSNGEIGFFDYGIIDIGSSPKLVADHLLKERGQEALLANQSRKTIVDNLLNGVNRYQPQLPSGIIREIDWSGGGIVGRQ